jgi:hypothetical protein
MFVGAYMVEDHEVGSGTLVSTCFSMEGRDFTGILGETGVNTGYLMPDMWMEALAFIRP